MKRLTVGVFLVIALAFAGESAKAELLVVGGGGYSFGGYVSTPSYGFVTATPVYAVAATPVYAVAATPVYAQPVQYATVNVVVAQPVQYAQPAAPSYGYGGTQFVPTSISGYNRQMGELNVSGNLYQNGQYVGNRTLSSGYDNRQNFRYP